MESVKPILLLVVLAGVGYGVYVALNRAPQAESAGGVAPDWNKPMAADTGRTRHDPARAPAPQKAATANDAGSPAGVAPASAAPPLLGSNQDRAGGSGSTVSSLPFGIGSHAMSQAAADNNPQNPQPAPSDNGVRVVPSGQTADQPAADRPAAEMALEKHRYEASMRAAEGMLAQGKLVDALRELSPWYDNPAVPPDQQARLTDLLGQLAGTVIYSHDHWLMQPHVVQQGESLTTIAQQYSVPWQLLAKVNGIQDPNSLQPGQELKVLRGPFQAQLNPQQSWLTMFVDGMYAGRFRVSGTADVNKPDGLYPVAKFPADYPTNYAHRPYISLGGDLHILVDEAVGQVSSGATAVRMSQRDMDDVFDILSERSQVTIRR